MSQSDLTRRLLGAFREGGFWALVAAGALVFYRVLLFSETFYFRDLFIYFLPQKQVFVDTVRAGELPLWNPLMHGGIPFFGDMSQHLLYPPNLLYFLLPVPRAMSLLIAGHVVAASLAAYLLARVLGIRPAAAALAGAVYAYCGPTLSNGNLMIRLFGTPWLVLVVLFFHLLLREGRRRYFALFVAAGVLQVFSGAPEMITGSLLTALGWGLVDPDSPITRRRRILLWLAAAAAIALLAAVQLLPTAELAGQSQRGAGMSLGVFGGHSLHPLRLPELWVPGFCGRFDSFLPTDYWGRNLVSGRYPYLLSIYLGAVSLVLAFAGAFHRASVLPRRLRLFLAALLGLTLVAALGRFLPGFSLVYEWAVPLRIFRYPIRVLALTVLPLALLAAAGSEALTSGGRIVRRVLTAAWVVIGLPLAAAWAALGSPRLGERLQLFFFDLTSEAATAPLRAGLVQALTMLVALTGVVLLAARRPSRGWGWLLLAVVFVDLSLAGRPINPSAPTRLVTAEPPVVAEVRRVVGEDGRFYRDKRPQGVGPKSPGDSGETLWLHRWDQEVLQYYLATAYGIPMIFHDDYTGLAPMRVHNLGNLVDALPWGKRLPILSAASVKAFITHEKVKLDGVVHVRTIANTSGVPFYLYRNERAASRAHLAYVWKEAGSGNQALVTMLIPGFDPRRHVVVEGPVGDQPRPECGGGRVEVRRRGTLDRAFSVTTPCRAVLVLAETFYPGWEARLDGEAVPVYRADSAFAALMVPPGEHEVVWRYVPRTIYVGLSVSLLSLLALGVGMRLAGRLQAGGR